MINWTKWSFIKSAPGRLGGKRSAGFLTPEIRFPGHGTEKARKASLGLGRSMRAWLVHADSGQAQALRFFGLGYLFSKNGLRLLQSK
jgi:hypothetical protein